MSCSRTARYREPERRAAAEEYVFINTQPYARKIEGTGGRRMAPQAPDGVYQAVATLAQRRFGNIARITFSLPNCNRR